MDAKYLVMALLGVPFILLISVSVFSGLALYSIPSDMETDVTNETFSATGESSLYDCKEGTLENCWTAGGLDEDCSTNCTVAYDNFNKCVLTIASGTPTPVNCSYTSYQGDSWDSYSKVYTQTISGQKLGSTIPYILIAISVITVLIGAFGLSRII